MMNVSQAIRQRRSIRKFQKGVEIPKEHMDLMLEAAMMAPSACNARPWEFVVVQDEDYRKKIVEIAPFSRPILEASATIVVCGRPDLQEKSPAQGFFPQDCGAAIENILLQALELGYGTVWCGIYPVEDRVNKVQQLLGIASIPVAVIAVGKGLETPAARGYFDRERVKYL